MSDLTSTKLLNDLAYREAVQHLTTPPYLARAVFGEPLTQPGDEQLPALREALLAAKGLR